MTPKLLNDTLGDRHTEVFKGSTKLKNFEGWRLLIKILSSDWRLDDSELGKSNTITLITWLLTWYVPWTT